MTFCLLFAAVLLFTVIGCLSGVALCRSLRASDWLEILGS